MLQIRNISKSYSNSRKVLDQLSLDVEKGEAIAIVGPSGSGKTTLLNIIGTLDVADDGEVHLKSKNLLQLSDSEKPAFRNTEIGTIFQLHHLLPQLSLWENVLLPTLPSKEKQGIENRAETLLKKVGIWEQRNQKPAELSGGECQRAAVVRALINQPSLLLADEPTGALDEENAEKLTDLLLMLNKEMNTTLIVVTHSALLASKMDKIYEIHNGQIVLKN